MHPAAGGLHTHTHTNDLAAGSDIMSRNSDDISILVSACAIERVM